MTQSQKNEAIAMRLGWEREQRGDSSVWIVPYPDGGAVSVRADLPNWCTDLNAVQRDLIPVLERHGCNWVKFYKALDEDRRKDAALHAIPCDRCEQLERETQLLKDRLTMLLPGTIHNCAALQWDNHHFDIFCKKHYELESIAAEMAIALKEYVEHQKNRASVRIYPRGSAALARYEEVKNG